MFEPVHKTIINLSEQSSMDKYKEPELVIDLDNDVEMVDKENEADKIRAKGALEFTSEEA